MPRSQCRNVVQGVLNGTAFPVPRDASLTFERLRELAPCEARPMRSMATDPVVPEDIRVLFIIGAQKGGTTWLASALHYHPSFHFADCKTSSVLEGSPGCRAWPLKRQGLHAIKPSEIAGALDGLQQGLKPRPSNRRRRRLRGIKEVHYFDTWPLPKLPYLSLFPKASTIADDEVLVDATPAYFYEAWAPALIKKIVPHARFVVRLRVRLVLDWPMCLCASVVCVQSLCTCFGCSIAAHVCA